MAAGFAVQFRVVPGRREEFLETLAQSRIQAEARGAEARTRQAFGGEGTGTLSRLLLFEDAAKRAAYLDSGGPSAPNATRDAVNSADPPATLLSLAFFDTVEPDGDIPPDGELMMTGAFRAAPGRYDEAVAAFTEARERHEGIGVSPTLWRVTLGGENSGAFARTVVFDNWGAQAAFQAKNAALPSPGPISRALRSGSLAMLRSYVSMRVDV